MAENSASKRHKSNDINETIDRAVSLPDKIGTSSVIFSLDFAVREVRLIEVTEDLLKQLSGQQPLKIIGPVEVPSGGGASDAVITSLDKTFSIKKVETSNAVYLIGPSYNDKYTVQSASQDYYEVKCIPPRLDKIKELCPEYNGIEAEIDNHFDVSRLLSYNELRNQIQASDAEFTAALFKFAVVDLCGKMRLLSKVAIRESTRHLVFTIMEQNWKLQHIDEDLCVRHIPEMDPVLLNFSLKSLGEKRNTDGTEGVGGAYWALDQDKISRATAHIQFNRQSDPTAVKFVFLFLIILTLITAYYISQLCQSHTYFQYPSMNENIPSPRKITYIY